MIKTLFATLVVALATTLPMAPAKAEEASYGAIELTGLARASWGLNPPGVASAMVCNVNGPDGFLSVRSGPGTSHAVKRRLKRLATLDVDTSQRRGNWVKVSTAYRQFSTEGRRQNTKSLHVEGWAHDGYLCDFIDF